MSTARKKTSKKDSDFEPTATSSIKFVGGMPKEMFVTVSAKVTTKPYENIDIGGGLTLTITDPNADLNKLRDNCFRWVTSWLQENTSKVRKRFNEAPK